jgi:hypothetical protein
MYEMDGWDDMNQICLNCFTRQIGEGLSTKVIHHQLPTHEEYVRIVEARISLQEKATELGIGFNIQWKPISEPNKPKPL